MIRSAYLFGGVAAFLSVVAATGCNQSSSAVSPAVLAEHQTRLVLAEEPDGAITVLDVREALLGESADTHDHDHADHATEEHAGHDHDDHAEEEHAGHHHDEHANEEHAGHDHEGQDDDEHAGHDHDEHADDEHAGHDHDDHADEEHAGHDHDDHADEEHAGHDHDAEHAHEHKEVADVKPTDPIDVLVVGTIGGLTNPWEETQPDYPFSKNEASFFLAEPGAVAELEASGHVHAPGEECAFCAAHAADGSALLAMVRFLDENGKILPIGVPQMFDVKAMDTVVIQGTARIVAGGMMVVDATGIYLRR